MSFIRIAALLIVAAQLAACAATAGPPASAASGQSAYAGNCLACHQADGAGVRGFQPALVGSPWVRGDIQALATFVLTGGFDSGARKGGANENVMPPFRHLDDATLAAILTYVRQTFGEHAGPVSAADVALARSHLPPAP
jgi:mono/diheme cytochrome c family protein